MRSQSKQNTDSHRLKVSIEDGGLLEYFFGKGGKKSLKLERFVQFFRDLHEEVCDIFFGLWFCHTIFSVSWSFSCFIFFLRFRIWKILRLEFAHYDFRAEGTILAKDFAFSLVASADSSDINKLLDRVDEIDNDARLKNIRITYKEFKDFAELRKNLQSFSLALFSYGEVNGVLTKSDLQRAASQVLIWSVIVISR